MFSFLRNGHTFSRGAVPFYIPIWNVWLTQFLHILTAFKVVIILFFSHSDKHRVTSHCGLIYISQMANGVEHFPCAYFPFIYLFQWNECHLMSYVHFLIVFIHFSLLSFENSWYIVDTSPLPVVWFANRFSVCSLSFHLHHKDFHRAKVFNPIYQFFFFFGSCFWKCQV